MDLQCYAKNDLWAVCQQNCTPGRNPFDKNEAWSCKEIGTRSFGLAIRGSPSLYCFAVIRTDGYEVDLMNAQKDRGAGIFGCDHHSLLTPDKQTTIRGEDTVAFAGAPIVRSVDGTAGNTEMFVHAWSKVIELRTWADHAFTAKVDADAVFLPEKLRWHLGDHVGTNMFVINCPTWNMIYGALEIFSFSAMQEWEAKHAECNAPADFGEDKYMTQCMDTLRVRRIADSAVVGDKLCGTFTDCSSLPNAAFHPFKDVGSWMDCYQKALYVIGAA